MRKLDPTLIGLAAVGLGVWMMTRRQREFMFLGKVVLITGGSRGLGLVLARMLTAEGARVAICARDQEELDRAAGDLTGHGNPPLALPCDVTDPQQVQDMIRAVEAHLGPVDVLINNAGGIQVGPMSTMTRQDYEDALKIHFWAPYNTIEAVLPSMRERQSGRIVNISSIGGKVGVPHLMPYSASKFALVGYSQALRAELADDGIVVTTVCPGLMRTGSPRNAHFKGKHESEYAWFSISDSLPLLTISAEQAARETLDACRRGDAEVTLSLPAKLAVKLQALFPNLVANLTSLANRLLPGPGDKPDRMQAKPGRESTSAFAPSVLTAPTEEAAAQNNELVR
jgi:NAD(P)-dependent dehydrogenase (short-subunit alcohol dehydrogenase family)